MSALPPPGSGSPDPARHPADDDPDADTHSCGFTGEFGYAQSAVSGLARAEPSRGASGPSGETAEAPPHPHADAEPASERFPAPQAVSIVLRRALRLRCPVCGEGRVFPDGGLRPADTCESCEWRFERCEGHWVGGSEINMLLTFPFGCAFAGVLTALIGFGVLTFVLAGLGVIGFSLAIQRQSRTVFLAIDYLIDPRADPASGGFRGFGNTGDREGPDGDPDADPGSGRPPGTEAAVDRRPKPPPACAPEPTRSRSRRRPGDRPAHT